MIKKYGKTLIFLLALAIIGQIIFLAVSGSFTKPHYESSIYATTGIKFTGGDLNTLNEGAHYFGQTAIGWTKFPNFRTDLVKFAGLPDDTRLNMHAQERQNFIFTVTTSKPITFDQLKKVKDYLQGKFDLYNSNTNTDFILTNVDYSQEEVVNSYAFGALITLVLTVAIGFAIAFVQKEFFPPRLKL